MITTPETRVLAAHRQLALAERRIRELRNEEQQAIHRRDYAAAITAARARMLQQEVYSQAAAVILKGGRKK